MFWEQRAEGGTGEEGPCPGLRITGFSQAYPGSMETYMVYFPMPGTPGGDWSYQGQQMTDWPDLGPFEV